jgi:hypothetical protein
MLLAMKIKKQLKCKVNFFPLYLIFMIKHDTHDRRVH